MLNKIWFWLLFLGILYALGKGSYQSLTTEAVPPPAVNTEEVSDAEVPADERGIIAAGKAINDAALDAASVSVEICIGLIGIMALWLGLLKIADDAGLVAALARLLRPLMRWLFPEVPDGHPAQGAMLMNISANMLGLDNAATPMGLKAMKELQTLNPTPDTATDSMATFLAVNTSSITLIPITIIGYRAAAGSTNAAQPMAGMLLATTVSTLVAIFVVRRLAKWPRFAMPGPPAAEPEEER